MEMDWMDEFPAAEIHGDYYPAPCDWVVDLVEFGGTKWSRFPGLGEGMIRLGEVEGIVDGNTAAIEDGRDCVAWLGVGDAGKQDSVEYTFRLDGDEIFRIVDPEMNDLWTAAAEVMARYSNHQDHEAVSVDSGTLPDDVIADQEIEQRAGENRSLGEFH